MPTPRVVLVILLLLTASAVSAAPPYGEIALPAGPLLPSVQIEEFPRVASDGESYLVVWMTARVVRAGRVTPTGELLDPEGFVVSDRRVFWGSLNLVWNGSAYVVFYDDMYAVIDRDGKVLAKDVPIPSSSRAGTFTSTWFGTALPT